MEGGRAMNRNQEEEREQHGAERRRREEEKAEPGVPTLGRTDVAVALDAQKVVSRGRSMNSKWRSLWAELGGVT